MIITNEHGTPALNTVHNCDALRLLGNMPSQSVNCIVTSPPYFGLRDYGVPGQIGLEETPQAYVAKLVDLFREARRVLRDDGTLWLNLGDSFVGATSEYAEGGSAGKNSCASKKTLSGLPNENRGARNRYLYEQGLPMKSLIGIPWRVAFGLQDDGWILRSDIIWAKPNPMPESVTDRPTKSHEYIFLFAKSQRYWYDADAIKEPAVNNGKIVSLGEKSFSKGQARGAGVMPSGNGNADTYTVPPDRNKRDVWTVTTKPFSGAHFATFPPDLIEPMILAGCPVGGVVYDPFMGAGTTALVARDNGRNYIGSELNPAYVDIARERLSVPHTPMFMELLA